jgi:hypothetical protein
MHATRNAVFVSPPAEYVLELLDDLEKFIHNSLIIIGDHQKSNRK